MTFHMRMRLFLDAKFFDDLSDANKIIFNGKNFYDLFLLQTFM